MSEKAAISWLKGKGPAQIVCWVLNAISFFWGLIILLCYVSMNAQKGVTAIPAFIIGGALYILAPFIMSICMHKFETQKIGKILFAVACVLAVACLGVGIWMLILGINAQPLMTDPLPAGQPPFVTYLLSAIFGIVCMPVSLLIHVFCLGTLKKIF